MDCKEEGEGSESSGQDVFSTPEYQQLRVSYYSCYNNQQGLALCWFEKESVGQVVGTNPNFSRMVLSWHMAWVAWLDGLGRSQYQIPSKTNRSTHSSINNKTMSIHSTFTLPTIHEDRAEVFKFRSSRSLLKCFKRQEQATEEGVLSRWDSSCSSKASRPCQKPMRR